MIRLFPTLAAGNPESTIPCFPHADERMNKQTLMTAALAAMLAGGTVRGQMARQDSLMREQADAFLRAMPAGLQCRQAEAVAKAMAGDCSDLAAVRSSRDRFPEISPEVRVRDLSSDLRLYEPAGADGRRLPLLIYFHGGGWTFGSINSCGRFCDAMAATGGMKVLAVNYRLAPEYPYPYGYLDCVASVKYAFSHARELGIDTCQVSLGGDSSGGNLAIATALDSACTGKIVSLVLFYPVTKAFADHSPSWKAFGKGYGLDATLMERFNQAYAPRIPSGIPQIDVGLLPSCELERLPRTLFVAAGRDILRDQGEEFCQRLAAGKILRAEFPEAVHLFITVPGQEAAFRMSVDMASRFLVEGESCD